MKWHKEIEGEEGKPYDYYVALDLFKKKKAGSKAISLMKQENIRIAFRDRTCLLRKIQDVMSCKCGYCMRYKTFNNDHKCDGCPLHTRIGNCYDLPEYDKMVEASTFEEAAKQHKEWCKKIGLWQEGWR